jgi:hypothetical protein
VDRLVEILATRMPPDALLAVTGDHGMVTMDHTIDADTHLHLRGLRTLRGEPRARHAHAEPGAAATCWPPGRRSSTTSSGWCPGGQAIDEGWFGPVSTRFADGIGDVVAAAHGTSGVTRSKAGAFLSNLIGQHRSLTSAEQLVPLLIARV